MFSLFIALTWIIIIGALIGALISGIRALPRIARDEQFRQQQEKEYLASIEKWKEWDMEHYQTFVKLNPFNRKNYYGLMPENRPKDIP